MININRLLQLYWAEHPNTTLIFRVTKDSCDSWEVVVNTELRLNIVCDMTSVIKTAMSYGQPILIVEQYATSGYEMPDYEQMFDDETMGY